MVIKKNMMKLFALLMLTLLLTMQSVILAYANYAAEGGGDSAPVENSISMQGVMPFAVILLIFSIVMSRMATNRARRGNLPPRQGLFMPRGFGIGTTRHINRKKRPSTRRNGSGRR